MQGGSNFTSLVVCLSKSLNSNASFPWNTITYLYLPLTPTAHNDSQFSTTSSGEVVETLWYEFNEMFCMCISENRLSNSNAHKLNGTQI